MKFELSAPITFSAAITIMPSNQSITISKAEILAGQKQLLKCSHVYCFSFSPLSYLGSHKRLLKKSSHQRNLSLVKILVPSKGQLLDNRPDKHSILAVIFSDLEKRKKNSSEKSIKFVNFSQLFCT